MVSGSIQENGSENGGNLSLFESSECIAWFTVLIVESVVTVTVNILTITVFVRNRSLRKRSMYLVINLVVADMFVGGFTEVLSLIEMGNRLCNVWRLNVTYLAVGYTIIWGMWQLFPVASTTNLAAISLERMHATFRPFKHHVINNWVIGVVITVTWVTAGLFTTVSVILMNISLVVHYYVWCSFISICLFIVFVSYTSILVKVFFKVFFGFKDFCGAHPQHHEAASRERKLTKTLFIVTLVSLIALLPHVVLLFLPLDTDTIISGPLVVYWRLYYSFLVLLFPNSLIYPILYTIRIPEFRRALFSLFRRQHREVQVQIPLRVIPGN